MMTPAFMAERERRIWLGTCAQSRAIGDPRFTAREWFHYLNYVHPVNHIEKPLYE